MNNKRFILSLIFIFVLVFSVSAVSALTHITDCTGLQNMKNDLAESYVLDNNIDCSITNTWNGGLGFEPVGNHSCAYPFTACAFVGIFDGQGYNITGLYINRPSTDYVGLFGYISGIGNKVINAGLKNVDITGHNLVGGLVGYSSGSNIDNSYVTGNVFGIGSSIGGLVGSSDGNILNSYATGDVKTNFSNAGGLVGSMASSWGGGSITNSYATGNVSSTKINNVAIGGLVGSSDGNILNSYATGNVFGIGNLAGGLVGHFALGNISNSYATGSVTGALSVGGLVGFFNSGFASNSYWYDHAGDSATQCYSDGDSGCTKETDINYFKGTGVTSVPPTSSWNFTNIWKVNAGDYPNFIWRVVVADFDGDGISDLTDNCIYNFNPDQLDSDNQDGGDVCDICPGNSTDVCAEGTGVYIVANTGGSAATSSGGASVSIPAGALQSDTSISITEAPIPPGNVQLGQSLGNVLASYLFNPDGAVFNSYVTVTLRAAGSCTNSYKMFVQNDQGAWEKLNIINRTASFPEGVYCDYSAQTLHFSLYVLASPVDSDGDGTPDSWDGVSDDCPAVVGSTQYYGCTGGAINAISTEKISNSALTSELLAACGGASKCTTSIYEGKAGVTSLGAKLYNKASLLSLLNTRTIPLDQLCSIYDGVGFNSALAAPNVKKADSSGLYGFGLSSVSREYALIQSVTEVVGGISSRVCILETIIPRNFNANVATREVNLISTTSRDTRNGLLVKKSAGHTSVVTGSELKITYPQYFEWAGAEELYPFIFESDSDWTIDLCAQVPSGYNIAGVVDDSGNSISTNECVQAGVANEMKVVLFKVADTGSPADFSFKTKIKTTHNGKTTSLDLEVPSKNRKAGAKGNGVTGRAIDMSSSGSVGWAVAIILAVVLAVILLRRKK